MNQRMMVLAIASVATIAVPVRAHAAAAALGGSKTSMLRQHEVAVTYQFGFMETPADVQKHIDNGHLEHVPGGADYALSNVSFPYAIAEVRQFIERLAAEYRVATGEQLVVTSLTRPSALQPANAHELSVHPAGMAVDLRIPARASARAWLQETLLELERDGVLDVTREHTPPHYHVAVYPVEYRAYVEGIDVSRAIAHAQENDTLVTSATEQQVRAQADARSTLAESGAARGGRPPFPLLVGSMVASIGLVAVRRKRNR